MESSIILSVAKEIKRKTAASRKKLADMILRFCNEK
jgi:hypothetical protein